MRKFFYINFFLLLVLCVVLFLTITYRNNTTTLIQVQENTITVLRDSIKTFYEDIEIISEYVYELERKKQPILVQHIVDTVTVTERGVNVSKLFTLPFETTERYRGVVYKVSGSTSFNWDFINGGPINSLTTLQPLDMRLNVSTEIVPVKEGYKIDINSLSPYVIITNNENNIVDEKTFLQRLPSKLSFGVHAGYGLMYDGVQPYVGIGITYNFYELSSIFKKNN